VAFAHEHVGAMLILACQKNSPCFPPSYCGLRNTYVTIRRPILAIRYSAVQPQQPAGLGTNFSRLRCICLPSHSQLRACWSPLDFKFLLRLRQLKGAAVRSNMGAM